MKGSAKLTVTIKAENASVQTSRLHVDTACAGLDENSPISLCMSILVWPLIKLFEKV